MTDEEVEKIIRSNMNLQMNLAGIRADFEEKLQRTWVGLTDEERDAMIDSTDLSGAYYYDDLYAVILAAEAKLKEKNSA